MILSRRDSHCQGQFIRTKAKADGEKDINNKASVCSSTLLAIPVLQSSSK